MVGVGYTFEEFTICHIHRWETSALWRM